MPARKVFIGVPSWDASLRVGTVVSLMTEIEPLREAGIEVCFIPWTGDSLLPHARNCLIGLFLASDCSDLIMLDSDVSWVRGGLQQILSHDADFVAGVYRTKEDVERYAVNWLPDGQAKDRPPLKEAMSVPGGFFRMTRAGLERVIAKCDPRLKYESHNAPGLACWYLFDLEFCNGRAWGEDYVFCKLIRSLGETIYVDPTLDLGHCGAKEYRGTLAAYLAAQQPPPMPDDDKRARLMELARLYASPERAQVFEDFKTAHKEQAA